MHLPAPHAVAQRNRREGNAPAGAPPPGANAAAVKGLAGDNAEDLMPGGVESGAPPQRGERAKMRSPSLRFCSSRTF